MKSTKTSALLSLFFLGLLAIAWISTQSGQSDDSCLVDGTTLLPISRVALLTSDGKESLFCSLCCAKTWLDRHQNDLQELRDQKASLTLVDEISGLELDASLAYFVESDEYSRKENKCKVHVFSDKQAASNYLRRHQGTELPGYLAGLGQTLSWAADFKLPDMYGKQRSLSEFQGQIVFLRFFSSKNPFVETDLSNLQEAQDLFHEQGFTVLAVNVEDNREDVVKILEKLQISYPVLFDPEGVVADNYQVTGFPTGFLLDQSGIVDSSSIGEVTADILAPFLHSLR